MAPLPSQARGTFLPSLLHLFFTRWQHQATSGSMDNKGEWDNFEGISQTELQNRNNKMWESLALLWRQISSRAFPPSALRPPSHLPSTLSILAAILTTSSVSLSSPFSMNHNCSACLLPVSPSNLFLIFLSSWSLLFNPTI